MTHKQRNTLALSILFVILLAIGVSVSRSYKAKNAMLSHQNQDIKKKIAVLNYQLSMIDSLRSQYELQQELLARQSKLIVDHDSPSITYQYLLSILNWMRKSIPFDFAVAEGEKSDTSYNEYIISGRALYPEVVRFVNNIEHQRSVITIEELTLGADTYANSDSIAFSMILRTHYKAGGAKPESILPKSVPPIYTGYNSFKSRIYDSEPTREYDPALVDINSCTLIAISTTRVFLRDSQRVIRILSPGDKVRDGNLYAIDVPNGKAIFKLNQYGVLENHTLFLNK